MHLEESLRRLEDAQLILLEPSGGPAAAFKHVLVQESAYQSLVRPERRRLHLLVGQTLESMFPDRREELADVLAQHFDEAGDAARAIDLYSMAGELAARRTANLEAAALFGRAFDLAVESRADEDVLTRLGARHGRSLELAGRQHEALAAYDGMVREARQRGLRRLEIDGLAAGASLQAVPTAVFDLEASKRRSDEALRLAQSQGDAAAESRILWTRMRAASEEDPGQALAYGERSLALARGLGLQEQVAFTLNDLQSSYLATGQFQNAMETLEEARSLWTSLDNLPMLTDSLISLSMLRLIAGAYDEADRLAQEGLAISERIGNVWGQSYARGPIGMIQFARLELGPAITTFRECIELAERAGFLDPQVSARSQLAACLGQAGDFEAARSELERAFVIAEGKNLRWRISVLSARAWLAVLEGDAAAARADLAAIDLISQDRLRVAGESGFIAPYAWLETEMLTGNFEAGLALVDEIDSWSQEYHLSGFDGMILTYRGAILRNLGRTDEARPTLHRALHQIEAHRLGAAAWRALAELAELEADAGEGAEAAQHRREAGDWLRTIAVGLKEPRLRRTFEATAAFRRVVEASA